MPTQEEAATKTRDETQSQVTRIQEYESKIEQLTTVIEKTRAKWKSLSMVRGLTFLVVIIFLVLGAISYSGQQTLWFLLALTTFLVFLYIAYIHEGLESVRRKKQIWLRLYRRSLARLNRDWDQLKQVSVEIPSQHAAICNDLDLFGQASLFQMVGGVETPSGIQTIRNWILNTPKASEILARQAAVNELKSKTPFRDKFRFLCHLLAFSDGGPATLTDWAEASRQYDKRNILVWCARVLAVSVSVVLLGLLVGLIPVSFAGPTVMGLLAANVVFSAIFAGRIHSIFNQVSTRHGEVDNYYQVFAMIREDDFQSERLSSLKSELFSENADVLAATNHLGRIAWQANLRRSLFPVYVLLQFVFLWDFHTVNQLQNWKAQHGKNVRRWFEILGHWEVLAAIGQFAYDHADWPMPEIKPKSQQSKIACHRLGHPLLKHTDRVDNDVTVGPVGSVLLVTGSNMSGKSTLLRSIGLNVVLAHLGAPICADSLSMSPMQIETSMRIQDSLADGVSFFMAELKRLKQIVDIAREHKSDPDATVLFLLDEILQGTNSQERHIAVTRVVQHLVDHQAIGGVSTHDLELGRSGELAQACHPVHFREDFQTVDNKKVMTFDYQLREGFATTTNALKLLELVGLDDN